MKKALDNTLLWWNSQNNCKIVQPYNSTARHSILEDHALQNLACHWLGYSELSEQSLSWLRVINDILKKFKEQSLLTTNLIVFLFMLELRWVQYYTGCTMSDNDAVLLEDIDHKLEAILEGQTLLAPMSQKLNKVDERLMRVESDVKIIKKVVTSHSQQIANHETRLTKLEDDDLEYA